MEPRPRALCTCIPSQPFQNHLMGRGVVRAPPRMPPQTFRSSAPVPRGPRSSIRRLASPRIQNLVPKQQPSCDPVLLCPVLLSCPSPPGFKSLNDSLAGRLHDATPEEEELCRGAATRGGGARGECAHEMIPRSSSQSCSDRVGATTPTRAAAFPGWLSFD